MQELVDGAREAFGVGLCVASLVDDGAPFGRFGAVSGESPAGAMEAGQSLPGLGVSRRVEETGGPLVAEDLLVVAEGSSEDRRLRARLHARLGVRFYAGAPLTASDGREIGSLCLFDGEPRGFGERDLATLRALAGTTGGRLEALGDLARERAAREESEKRHRRGVLGLADGAGTGGAPRANEASNEASLAAAQRIARLGSWEADFGSETARWSDELFRLHGFAPGEFVPTQDTFLGLVHPDDRGKVGAYLRDPSADGGIDDAPECRIVRPDGEVRVVHNHFEVRVDEAGEPVGLAGTVQDITERKAVEEALRESEERFRTAFEDAPVGVALTGLNRGYLRANRALCEMLGYSEKELLTKTSAEITHPEDREKSAARVEEALRVGSGTLEKRYVRADGSVAWAMSSVSVVRDAEGRPDHFVALYQDITARKEAERALKASEARLRTVIEQSPLGVHIFAPDGTSLLSNAAWGELWRLEDGEEPEGRSIFEDEHLRALGLVGLVERGASEGVASAAPPVLFDPASAGREGDPRWLKTLVYPVKDEGGRLVEVVLLLEDVTEQREAEKELRQAEERYRALVENIPAAAYTQEAGRFFSVQYLSPRVEDLTGYLSEDFARDPDLWYRVVHPDDREGLLAEDERTERTGEPFGMEYRIVRRDGRVVWVRDEAVLVRGEGGEPLFWQGIMTDTTERRRAEEKLREAEERYRLLVEQVPAVVYVDGVDSANSAIYRSAHVERMLGYASEEFSSEPGFWQKLLHPDDRERVLAENERTNETGEPFGIEYRMVAKDGSAVWVRDEAVLIRGAEGQPLYWQGVFMDVTERKRAEEEVKEANRRLSDLATLRADFTAMVAHELDTPLAVIRAYADIIATGELSPEERGRALSRIQAEADVLDELVEDVRTASSAEREDFAVKVRPVPVGRLLEDAARFAGTLPGDHEISVEDAVGGEVRADGYRIGQVLRNLLSNAAKYSPDGTPIGLRAVRVPGAAGDPDRVRLEVSDRGRGIHPDDLVRIFEKFGRGRDPEGRRVTGLGLGLYLSRRILQAHGSDILLRPAPGGGSVLGFDLEVARG